MTAKENALRLIEKFIAPTMDRGLCNYYKSFNIAKECALIAVDEILNLCWNGTLKAKEYWQEVKEEILKL